MDTMISCSMDGSADRLLDALLDWLPRSAGAGLVLVGVDEAEVVGSRRVAWPIDRLQLSLDEGPVVTAHRCDEPVSSPDLRHDHRWPALRRRIDPVADGVSAVCVPGVPSRHGLLVLSTYVPGQRAMPLDWIARRCQEAVARHSRRYVRDVQAMLLSRSHIEQAKGVVTALSRCGPEQSFARLREVSQRDNVRLRDLALALVEQASSPRPAAPSPGSEAQEAARRLWKELDDRG